jgi:hypothetical protein
MIAAKRFFALGVVAVMFYYFFAARSWAIRLNYT